MRELEDRVKFMMQTLGKIQGLTPARHVPVIANLVPHLTLEWDEAARKLSSTQVVKMLQDGDPPIHVQRPGDGKLLISVWMMRAGEHRIVTRRLQEIFQHA